MTDPTIPCMRFSSFFNEAPSALDTLRNIVVSPSADVTTPLQPSEQKSAADTSFPEAHELDERVRNFRQIGAAVIPWSDMKITKDTELEHISLLPAYVPKPAEKDRHTTERSPVIFEDPAPSPLRTEDPLQSYKTSLPTTLQFEVGPNPVILTPIGRLFIEDPVYQDIDYQPLLNLARRQS